VRESEKGEESMIFLWVILLIKYGLKKPGYKIGLRMG
jgi:hypothetical protein